MNRRSFEIFFLFSDAVEPDNDQDVQNGQRYNGSQSQKSFADPQIDIVERMIGDIPVDADFVRRLKMSIQMMK